MPADDRANHFAGQGRVSLLMPGMKLSIIVPNLNDGGSLAQLLPCLGALEPVEVIVCDGGSSDHSRQVVEAHGARWCSSPPGRGKQLRAGAALAMGDVYLLLHADCRPDPRMGGQIASALLDANVQGGAFRQYVPEAGWPLRLVLWGNAQRVKWLGLAYGDQGVFVRAEFYQQIGGIPDLPLMEDVAFMQAFCRKSWPVLLPGPLEISPRRWKKHGVLWQTLQNWGLVTAFRLGTPAERLARWYRRHDQ